MIKRSQFLLVAIVFALFAIATPYAQNNSVKSISDAEYSQKLINQLQVIRGGTNALLKTGVPDRAKNNMTMLLFQAKKNENRLTAEAKDVFKSINARPTGLSSTYSETAKNFFKFYYTTSGADAVATADANSNGTPDYVENMATAFVRALTVYDSLGYARPPIASSDGGKYCVYLSNSAAGTGVYGYAQPETLVGNNPNTTATENSAMTSFMVMRNNYTGFGTGAAMLQIAMEVTTAHEFFHAIQFGYETNNMTGFPMEMCATWGEDIVFPGDDDNWQYLTGIFDTPDISIDYDDDLDGTTITSGHWYAAWIFERYLTDRFGADVTLKFYQATVTDYWSTALNNVLGGKGTSLTNAIEDYNIAIGLLTSSTTAPMSTYRFARGNDYRTATNTKNTFGPFVVKYDATINYTGTKATFSSGSGNLYRASADFIKIVPNTSFSLDLAPTATTNFFYARLLKMNSYTNPTKLAVIEPTVSGSHLTFNVADQSSYSNYVLVVYNIKYASSTSRTITSIQYNITVDAPTSTKVITLTSPVNLDKWPVSTTQNITWTSGGVTNVKIDYTTDFGSKWTAIVASTPAATGSYAWALPGATGQYNVRVRDIADSTISATSGIFYLQTPSITITSPAQGTQWTAGTAHNITWTSIGVTNVSIQYSTDGGFAWNSIMASTPSSAGSYSWIVPNVSTKTAVIRLFDAANSTITNRSWEFEIVGVSPVVVTSPAGGESWPVGSTRSITWTSTGISNVAIEYSTDNGSTWISVVASVAASSGTYAWKIPNTLSTVAKIRISDATNAATNYVSNAFAIVTAPLQATVLEENFTKVTSNSIATPGTTDIYLTLDTYLGTAGWSGSKIYQAGGAIKLGSASAIGYIVTPALDLSASAGTGMVKFALQTYGSDAKPVQVMLSTDGGTTFNQVGANITPTGTMVYQSVAFTGGTNTSKIKFTASAAAANRFYLDSISVITGGVSAIAETNTKNIPIDFSLKQNYPNPFNPSTRISFSVAQADHIMLNVYNVQGEKVSSLINEHMTPGEYSVVFDASSLPSGVYYYRLVSSTVNSAKKMILMK